MGRYELKCCVVLFLSNFLFINSINADDHSNNQLTNLASSHDLQWYVRRKPDVWYSVLTGRKKRNTVYDENYRVPPLEHEKFDALIDVLQDEPPWTVLTINEGKRHNVNFTPRLGRESDEETEADNTNWIVHESELNKELLNQRSPPFAPRLGRRMNTVYFNPRLGKRNNQ